MNKEVSHVNLITAMSLLSEVKRCPPQVVLLVMTDFREYCSSPFEDAQVTGMTKNKRCMEHFALR